jgi:hypothetical protein
MSRQAFCTCGEHDTVCETNAATNLRQKTNIFFVQLLEKGGRTAFRLIYLIKLK